MRSWTSTAVLFLLAVALAPAPADACFAPAVPRPRKAAQPAPPPELTFGTPTAVLAWDPGAGEQYTTLIPQVSGELKKFALLIPVRGKLKKRDLQVLSDEVHFQLLAATRPRVELTVDPDPCAKPEEPTLEKAATGFAEAAPAAPAASRSAADYGVKVEAHFEVGEYDLALLSARSAKGLGRWLRRFSYRVTPEVEAALGDALKDGYRVLAARVHLKKLAAGEFSSLRPLRIRTRLQDGKPTLPLGVGAAFNGPGEVVVLALGPDRADLTSHRMLELPVDRELPAFVTQDWDEEYGRFATSWLTRLGGGAGALLEFAGPAPVMNVAALGAKPGATLTRWRVRVEAGAPDLVLAPARNSNRYQSVFRARRPWDGAPTCAAGRAYLKDQRTALREQAESYALLSGERAEDALTRLESTYPASFRDWRPPKPRPANPKTAQLSPDDDGGLLDSWWKIAAALGAFVMLLIGIGRLQRGR